MTAGGASCDGVVGVVDPDGGGRTVAGDVWFPNGIDDPHLILIKSKIETAEYWDASNNKMLQLFALAKAAVTGEQPRKIGEHEKIAL